MHEMLSLQHHLTTEKSEESKGCFFDALFRNLQNCNTAALYVSQKLTTVYTTNCIAE